MDENQVYFRLFEAEGRKMMITGNEDGISSLHILTGGREAEPERSWLEDQTMFEDAVDRIGEYLRGERRSFGLKLNPAGTDFQKKVWAALQEIPYGELRTYGEIAAAAGNKKAARAVGMANNRNPIPLIIPCHRVVGASGQLVGYAYGLELKGQLINMERIIRLYELLFSHYGKQHWWPAESPFEMMTGAVLVQNTAWRNVEKALEGFEGKLSPSLIEEISRETLAEIIRPSGFYNQKAARLKALTEWFGKYDCAVDAAKKRPGEELRRELLSISGIGRETADSILLYALEKKYFIVDGYARRIFSRIGISVPDEYDAFRLAVEDVLPPDIALYNEFHALLVEHGKRYCRKKPLCDMCPMADFCLKGRGRSDHA